VIKNSNRWQKLEIRSKKFRPIANFLAHSRCLYSLPRLQELRLYHSSSDPRDNWEENRARPASMVLFANNVSAPLLQTVDLRATYLNHSQMLSLTSVVTNLRLENQTNIPCNIMMKLLQVPYMLQVLRLINVYANRSNWPQRVELPQSLRLLEVRGSDWALTSVMSNLLVPGLETFILGECQPEAGSEMAAESLLLGSEASEAVQIATKCLLGRWDEGVEGWGVGNLRELLLEYSNCSHSALEGFLRATPNVNRLYVSGQAVFIVLHNIPGILPNLQRWVVEGSTLYKGCPLSDILTHRPDVKLIVKGDLTEDGKAIYDTLKCTHDRRVFCQE